MQKHYLRRTYITSNVLYASDVSYIRRKKLKHMDASIMYVGPQSMFDANRDNQFCVEGNSMSFNDNQLKQIMITD